MQLTDLTSASQRWKVGTLRKDLKSRIQVGSAIHLFRTAKKNAAASKLRFGELLFAAYPKHHGRLEQREHYEPNIAISTFRKLPPILTEDWHRTLFLILLEILYRSDLHEYLNAFICTASGFISRLLRHPRRLLLQDSPAMDRLALKCLLYKFGSQVP